MREKDVVCVCVRENERRISLSPISITKEMCPFLHVSVLLDGQVDKDRQLFAALGLKGKVKRETSPLPFA